MPTQKDYKCSYSKDKFLEIHKHLVEHGKDFTYVNSGSTKKITYGKFTYVCVDTDKISGSGFHICTMLKKDIDAYIESHKGEPIGNNKKYKEQLFNLKAIEESIGKVRFAIDINDCYWRTTHLLGYTTLQTYLKGLRKKEWKVGRNASIGSLIKQEITTPYLNGKEQRGKRVRAKINPHYYAIRNHIISHVYDMFMELYALIGDDFCMYLTDCIFTSPSRYNLVKSFFQEKGYTVKMKEIEFIKHDREKKSVHWFEASEKGKPIKKQGITIDYRTGMKYYQYCKNQIM